ncbi:MAG TPA: ABC transporter substrate-binding protein, partial [Caldimonas sp.]
MKKIVPWLFAATLAFAVPLSQAVTLRVSDQGDVQSMDPHSLNESLQLSFTGNVYESLIERDKTMGLAPALATKWTQQSPTVWRFDLRQGVKFHDG